MKYKQLIIGVAIGSILTGSGMVLADSNITAVLSNSIQFKFNGKAQIPSDGVLVYNDRTYVPARFVAEQLGATVNWDDTTKTVNITSAFANNSMNGSSGNSATLGQTTPKTYAVDQDITTGPMKMHISQITLDPTYKPYPFFTTTEKAIILSIDTQNTSANTLKWYPAAGTMMLNTQEQSNIGFSADVGGEYVGNEKKSGKIVFTVQSNLDKVTELKYKIAAPLDDLYQSVGDASLTDIVLK